MTFTAEWPSESSRHRRRMRPIPSIVVEPQGNWPCTQDCAAFYRLIDDGKFGNAKVTAPRHSNIFSRFLVGRVARGAALSLTIRIGALGLGFAQAVLIARLLGPAGYGDFAVTLSAATLVASFALLGLGGFAVREVSTESLYTWFRALKTLDDASFESSRQVVRNSVFDLAFVAVKGRRIVQS